MNETKAQILELAVEQLKKGGYPKLNFKDIADALDITRANIHHHFKNKESLAKEAIKANEEFQIEIIKQVYEQNLSLKESLAFMESHIWQDLENTEGRGVCACSHLLSDPNNTPSELIEFSLGYFFNFRELMESFFKRAHENGELNDVKDWQSISAEVNLLFYGFLNIARVVYDKPEARAMFQGLITKSIECYLKK